VQNVISKLATSRGFVNFVMLMNSLVRVFTVSSFLPRDVLSANRGIVIACLSVCPSVTLVNCDHIGWNSSKIISPLVSLGRSLFATLT